MLPIRIAWPLLTFVLALPAHAQPDPDTAPAGGTYKVENPLKTDDFIALLNSIIDTLILIAVPVTVIMVVYAGFLYTTSAGNETKVKTANRTVLYAAIGFGVLLLSKSVVTIVNSIVNG